MQFTGTEHKSCMGRLGSMQSVRSPNGSLEITGKHSGIVILFHETIEIPWLEHALGSSVYDSFRQADPDSPVNPGALAIELRCQIDLIGLGDHR